MTSIGLGLLLEEHRAEITARWRQAVVALGDPEPALGYVVGPLLRELALALRDPDGGRGAEAWSRCAVLVRSGARPGQLARETRLLLRELWEAICAAGHAPTPAERLRVDGWVLDALAELLDRTERLRARLEALEPAGAPPAFPFPPPLPPGA